MEYGRAAPGRHAEAEAAAAFAVDERPGDMGAPPLLELSGVSRVYGKRTALATMNLRLRSGKCVALLGHNGSGKSTLLRIAAGRDRPSTGTVKFDGKPMNENDPAVRARV